jgi:hypothetical protein
MPTIFHKCPNCEDECDCEKGSEILAKTPDAELEVYDCDHDCDEPED